MTRYVTGLTLGVALTLAFTAFAVAQKDKEKEDEDVVAARKDVVDLVAAIKAGKEAKVIDAKVKAIKNKHEDLINVMAVFKLKGKGGLGIGAKPAAGDGIEKRFGDLAAARAGVLMAPQLKAQEAELIEMAQVTLAMAHLVKPYYVKPIKGNNQRDWNGYADDQKKASEAFIKAVKAGDGRAVRRAAADVVKACNDCHIPFR